MSAQFGWVALASLAFQVYPTTLFGYWVWNTLISRHSVSSVAPVALLVPVFAMAFAFLIFGAMPALGQMLGIAFILVGLLVSLPGFRRRSVAVRNSQDSPMVSTERIL
jgi:O-acetylserine/cysteine efflux transporter